MRFSKLAPAPAAIALGCPDCAAAGSPAGCSAERRHLLSPLELLAGATPGWPSPRSAGTPRLQRCRQIAGTRVRIAAAGDEGADPRMLSAALAAAFGAFERVERRLGVRRAGADLEAIARGAHQAPVAVDPWTYEVLERSCALARESQGALDPVAQGGRLAALGLLPELPGAPPPDPGATFEDLHCAGGKVGARRPLRLDLSGLAQGFAIDRAVAALEASGARQGLVEAGGDLRVFGGVTVALGVRHPAEPQKLAVTLRLEEGAIATTSTHGRHQGACGRTVRQLLRPWDGAPLSALETVSGLADTAFEADALTRMLLFRRLRAEEHFLRRGAMGLRIDRRGRVSWVGGASQKVA